MQSQERFAGLRTQARHDAPQLLHAAAVAAVADHLVECAWRASGDVVRASRAKTVDTDRQWTVAAARRAGSVPLQWHVARCRGGRPGLVQSCRFSNARRKNSGESVRGFPGLIIQAHLRRGMCGKGSTKRPVRPQIEQRSHSRPAFPAGPGPDCSAATAGVVIVSPQPNGAGEMTERED